MKKALLVAGIAAGALSAPAMAQVSVQIGIGAPMAPPPPIVETVPPPPAYGYVWVPGYWGWTGDRYVWIRGRHVYGRPGYAWAPDHWERHGDRWHHVHGGWERDRHWRGERGERERGERERGEHRGRGDRG